MSPCTPHKLKRAALASNDSRVWLGVVDQAQGAMSVEWFYAKDVLAHDKKGRRNLFIDMLKQQYGREANLYVLSETEAEQLRAEMRKFRASAEYRAEFARNLKKAREPRPCCGRVPGDCRCP